MWEQLIHENLQLHHTTIIILKSHTPDSVFKCQWGYTCPCLRTTGLRSILCVSSQHCCNYKPLTNLTYWREVSVSPQCSTAVKALLGMCLIILKVVYVALPGSHECPRKRQAAVIIFACEWIDTALGNSLGDTHTDIPAVMMLVLHPGSETCVCYTCLNGAGESLGSLINFTIKSQSSHGDLDSSFISTVDKAVQRSRPLTLILTLILISVRQWQSD